MEPPARYRPDCGREAIDSFILGLSSWDQLYARRRLNEISIAGLASLIDLPPELILCISEYITLQDVLNCRLACRDWNEVWASGPVMKGLSHMWFAAPVELHESESIQTEHFVKEINNHLRIHAPERSQRLFIPWNDGMCSEEFGNEHTNSAPQNADVVPCELMQPRRAVVYQDGMLAWQPDHNVAIVDNLRTRRRQRYVFGDVLMHGWTSVLQAISRELAVFSIYKTPCPTKDSHCRELKVRHILLNEWRRVVSPRHMMKIYLHNNVVIAITGLQTALLWTYEGGAREIDLAASELAVPPKDHETHSCLPGAIFHPTRPDVVFFIWIYSPTDGKDIPAFTVIVIKYANGRAVDRFQGTYEDPRRGLGKTQIRTVAKGSKIVADLHLRCQQQNSRGLYMIGLIQAQASKSFEPQWSTLSFNVLTERFSQLDYKIPETTDQQSSISSWSAYNSPALPIAEATAWDNQLITFWPRNASTSGIRTDVCWITGNYAGESFDSHRKPMIEMTEIYRDDITDVTENTQGRASWAIFADDTFVVIATNRGFVLRTYIQTWKNIKHSHTLAISTGDVAQKQPVLGAENGVWDHATVTLARQA